MVDNLRLSFYTTYKPDETLSLKHLVYRLTILEEARGQKVISLYSKIRLKINRRNKKKATDKQTDRTKLV